jgi:TATA-binding protein-associated factor
MSSNAFAIAVSQLSSDATLVRETIGDNLGNWYQMIMTPPGARLDASLFTKVAKASTAHNVDKPMMEGDLSLLDAEAVMETRLAAAKALAGLQKCLVFQVRPTCPIRSQTDKQDNELLLLKSYLASPSAHQVYMASSIVTESDSATPISGEITTLLLGYFERPRPATYSEMSALLKRIQIDCQALMQAFNTEAKVSKDRIPTIPTTVDPLSTSSSTFSLATAQMVISKHFDALCSLLSKHAAKNVLPSLKDRQMRIMISVGKYGVMKERYDTQVMAGIGGALVALGSLPAKIGPVVKAIMDSVKVSPTHE